jgi:hypothetical protein
MLGMSQQPRPTESISAVSSLQRGQTLREEVNRLEEEWMDGSFDNIKDLMIFLSVRIDELEEGATP